MLLLSSWSLLALAQKREIHAAAERDELETFTTLIEKNPTLLNVIGAEKRTPLMTAVLAGSSRVVEYLLIHGADTSIPEKDGYTPIHACGFQGRVAIASLLQQHDPHFEVNPVHRDGGEQKTDTRTC